MKAFKNLSRYLVAMILVLAACVVNAADEKPSGTITITSTEGVTLQLKTSNEGVALQLGSGGLKVVMK